MTFDQVFVRHISDCRFTAVFAAVEVLEVAVHIFLSPMKLPIQSALSIRDWSHIEENGFPEMRDRRCATGMRDDRDARQTK